ncbi:MAG: hypothetical protein WBM07_00600 [Chitinivibrionales bacterium]
MIPSVVILKIRQENSRGINLWLPVFFLWPVFLILFLFVLPLLLIADFILLVCGVRLQLLRMIWGVFSVVSSLRGTRIKVNKRKENSIVNVTIL